MIIHKLGHKIEFDLGSSIGYPGYRGVQTSDIKLWFRIDEGDWKRSPIKSQLKAIKQFEQVENEEELNMLLEILEDKYD